MIKAIIFDCFGVLTTDTWKEFAETLPTEQREDARQLNHAYDRGHLTKAEFIDGVRTLTGRQPKYVEDALDPETTKNQQLLDYIATLKPNYKIGLLSNVATNWIREHFLNIDEQKLFDKFILSYEVGVTKPDPKMFQLIAERLGEPLENCVLIDDIERYCAAARDLGMQAIVYQNFGQMETELQQLLADTKR